MTFTTDFSGAAGTKLTAANPAWTLISGTDDFDLNGSGGFQRAVTGANQTAYATYDDGISSPQTVSADFLGPATMGIMVLGSSSGGLFSGYYLKPQTNALSFRLWRVNAGVVTQIAVSSATPDGIGITFTATIQSGNVVFEARRQGTLILSFTDSSASKILTGRRGIITTTTSTVINPLDNYSDNSTNGPTVTLTHNEVADGFVFEGLASTPDITFSGSKAIATGTIERQLELDDGTVVSAWSSSGMSAPTTTRWLWVPDGTLMATLSVMRTDGKEYRLRVREAANTTNTVAQSNTWTVGIVIPYNDQSLDAIMSENGIGTNGSFSSVRDNACRVMYANTPGTPNSGVTIARIKNPNRYGSGLTATADEIGRQVALGNLPNIPIMLVNITVPGQTMTDWNSDAAFGSWSLLQYMTYMLEQAGGRISALMRSVVVWSGDTASAITAMNQIITNVETRLPNQPVGYTFPVWVRGGPRATRSASSVLNVRSVCDALGSQGGRYRRLTGPVIDMQTEGANNLHQATGDLGTTNNSAIAHIQGSRRLGFRQGRGVAALVQELLSLPVTIERFGPSVVSREFTGVEKTTIRVTYDRDTKTLDNSTTAIPQFYVSTDNKVTWVEVLARKTGARTYELDHPTGNWQGQTVHFAYCMDSPWGTGDDTLVTPLLAKLVYDATDFGEGTEMVAMTGEGLVADASGVTIVNIEATVAGGNTLAVSLTIQP